MTLHLPPAEPPAESVGYFLDVAAGIAAEIAHAETQLALLLVAKGDPDPDDPAPAFLRRLRLTLEYRLATERLAAWYDQQRVLRTRARDAGVTL